MRRYTITTGLGIQESRGRMVLVNRCPPLPPHVRAELRLLDELPASLQEHMPPRLGVGGVGTATVVLA